MPCLQTELALKFNFTISSTGDGENLSKPREANQPSNSRIPLQQSVNNSHTDKGVKLSEIEYMFSGRKS